MPNTPCLVRKGALVYCLGTRATVQDGENVERLLKSIGCVGRVEERLMDAVTGLSGSGPAFVYTFIEALTDGGVLMGLPRELSSQLAAQTVQGAAEMLQFTKRHPASLRDDVASPGGTTMAGIEALEVHGLRSAVIAAVRAATERSEELGSD
jgi:pyrroline-5-carboxylate reductase